MPVIIQVSLKRIDNCQQGIRCVNQVQIHDRGGFVSTLKVMELPLDLRDRYVGVSTQVGKALVSISLNLIIDDLNGFVNDVTYHKVII